MPPRMPHHWKCYLTQCHIIENARLSTRCECCLKPPCRKEQYGHGDDGLGGGAPLQVHYNLERRRRRKKKGIGKSDPPRIPLFISLLYLNAPPRAAAAYKVHTPLAARSPIFRQPCTNSADHVHDPTIL